jgi:hypothetical protein
MNRILTLSVLAVLLLSTTTLSASTAPSAQELPRYVIAGGGGRSEAGDYVLRGAAGQPVAGTTGQGTFDLCSGFWCGEGIYTAYLPFALNE